MTHYEEVVMLADKLTMEEKARLMEHLSAALRHDLESGAYKEMPWHEFIEKTYGSLADDPIERPPQLPLEDREPLE